MELKTRYQYTYFIYPYLIEEKNYSKYLYNLLKRKNCKLKLFETKKDVGITSYFFPEIQAKMFWSLDLKKEARKQYEKMDTQLKATVLSQKPCNIFDYELETEIQGKIDNPEGIFFTIGKIQIICFQTGICFLILKTVINSSNNFTDVLNFNYKFRDIYSDLPLSKQHENIKIQTEQFTDIEELSKFIREIVGSNTLAKQINLDFNRFNTYAYTCLEQSCWNENTEEQQINQQFQKYQKIEPAQEQLDENIKGNSYEEKYLKIRIFRRKHHAFYF